MSPRRVAVTGIGVVSAFGDTFGEFWTGVAAGLSAIRPMTLVAPGTVRFPNAAEAAGFDPLRYFEEKEAGFLDRFAQFAAVAAREAITASGLRMDAAQGRRCAVVTGSSAGGRITEDANFRSLYAGNGRVSPLTIPLVMDNAGASRISREFGIMGPVYTVSTACSSANHAIGQAFWMVRNGVVDAAIAGGSEAPFAPGFLKAWEAMRVVSADTCRPFSLGRRGLILGEGAAMLVLEPLEAARARGAQVWGEIAGFGMSSDAHHLTQPLADGAALAMRNALADAAGSAPEAIGYINAHGTGTQANDIAEVEAIHAVFGAHAKRVAVSSTKSMHGHALGAAGALEAAATLAAMRGGLIPPTANFVEADPACDLDVVPNHSRPVEFEGAMSNSFAFGGLNAVLVFRRA
jgi:nodulation protein E